MNDISRFLFVELAEGKSVEVLRIGVFRDTNGRTVEISDQDLDIFVANFETGTAGQEVPVDVEHNRGEAAGWVKALLREDDKLLAQVDWNALGKRLVGEKIYRYLSATIDIAKKTIKSISLVNFPAVKGLRPVELSEGVYGLQAEAGLLERLFEAIRGVFEEGGKEGSEEAEFVIRKEGNEIILYSSDGSKVLGRFPFGPDQRYKTEEAAREAAEKREQQIQYFKHIRGGEMEEDWAELQGNIKSIIGAWARWAGSFTRCVKILKGKPGITDEEALCAWLHKQAEGKWPAEGSEYSPTLAELETMVEVLGPIIAELGGKEVSEMTEEEKAKLREEIREELLAEMAEKEKTLVELREQMREELEAEMTERFERRQGLVAFAEEICGNDGVGLSASVDEVVTFLEALSEDQIEAAKKMLKSKIVEFGERGSSREGQSNKKELPAEYAAALDAGDISLADLKEAIIAEDLGDLDEYALSKWQE